MTIIPTQAELAAELAVDDLAAACAMLTTAVLAGRAALAEDHVRPCHSGDPHDGPHGHFGDAGEPLCCLGAEAAS